MVYYNIIRGEEKRIPHFPPPPSPTFFGCLNYYFIIKLLNYNGQGQVRPLSCRQGTPQVGSTTKRNKIRNLKEALDSYILLGVSNIFISLQETRPSEHVSIGHNFFFLLSHILTILFLKTYTLISLLFRHLLDNVFLKGFFHLVWQ